jgi:hypothetical protein
MKWNGNKRGEERRGRKEKEVGGEEEVGAMEDGGGKRWRLGVAKSSSESMLRY